MTSGRSTGHADADRLLRLLRAPQPRPRGTRLCWDTSHSTRQPRPRPQSPSRPVAVCATSDCASPAVAKGLCNRCYCRNYYQEHKRPQQWAQCHDCGKRRRIRAGLDPDHCGRCAAKRRRQQKTSARPAQTLRCPCGTTFTTNNGRRRWCDDCRAAGRSQTMGRRRYNSGRSGTGHRTYRRNRQTVLATSDVCWLCGHPGAQTVDHVTPAKHWPKGPDGHPLPGLDDLDNLRPAHGTAGNRSTGTLNPCPTCGQLCNQRRGTRQSPAPSPRSEDW